MGAPTLVQASLHRYTSVCAPLKLTSVLGARDEGWLIAGSDAKRRDAARIALCALLAVLVGWTMLAQWISEGVWPPLDVRPPAPEELVPGSVGPFKTLVVYTFTFANRSNDSQSALPEEDLLANLHSFVSAGVTGTAESVDTVILLSGASPDDPRLPSLPPNAHYVSSRSEPSCGSWGSLRWAAARAEAEVGNYSYFVFISSTARGPFLPAYAPKELWSNWAQVLTSKLTGDVKLVGPVISCEAVCAPGHTSSPCVQMPHVLPYVFATDQVGLRTILAEASSLECPSAQALQPHQALWRHPDVALSAAIIGAGYNIDSLQWRYQGVDWRQANNRECNRAYSPMQHNSFDGVSPSVFELVFVDMAPTDRRSKDRLQLEARKVSRWQGSVQDHNRNISGNWYLEGRHQLRVEAVLLAKAKGPNCFDWEYYFEHSPDVASMSKRAAWHHFLSKLSVEPRKHRWKCMLDAKTIVSGRTQSALPPLT